MNNISKNSSQRVNYISNILDSPTPYDDIFRTLLSDCKELILPVLNEVFGMHYTEKEEVQLFADELFISLPNKAHKKRVVDSLIGIKSEPTIQYHIECQTKNDGTIMIRIFEYDSQIALNRHEFLNENTMLVRFPQTAILYLESSKYTSDTMNIIIRTSSGDLLHKVPTIKVKDYTTKELFEKNLLFLLPYHIFSYSKYVIDKMEHDSSVKYQKQLEAMLEDFKEIRDQLESLNQNGKINEYTEQTLRDLIYSGAKVYLKNHATVQGKVEKIMGGQILQYEAKNILNEGISQGIISAIKMCKNQFGKTIDETIQAIKDAYQLSQVEAESIVKENWK